MDSLHHGVISGSGVMNVKIEIQEINRSMSSAVTATSLRSRPSAGLSPRRRIVVSSVHNDTRYMMRVLLEMWGYEVSEAMGLDDTLESARDNHADLILVDTSREFENDLEMISTLSHSKELGWAQVIVMSGYSQRRYQRAALECGASGFLTKPLDLDLFESYVRTALNN